MAFTTTTLSTTSLLETTFISDMRLIVNANTTLLKSQIEEVINTLQIDLVNKYIGVDSPIEKVYSNSAVISDQILFKAGTSGSAATIASLTQTAGVSTFLADNITFTKNLKSIALGSKISSPTIVVGTTAGNGEIFPPNTGGVPNKGLYVGDASNPIPSVFYGRANFASQAITQSATNGTREITLTANSNSYTYANLVLSKTDPQFISIDLKLPAGWTQTSSLPIWLLLHEDFTSADTRPDVGQTFTIIINKVLDSGGTIITSSNLPAVSNTLGNPGINIISGWKQDASAAPGALKSGYINFATWAPTPTSSINAVTAIGTTHQYARFYNQYGQNTTVPKPRASAISFTKTSQEPQYSYFTITNSNNAVILN